MNEGKTPCPAVLKPRSKSNREVAAGQTRDTPRRQVPAIPESEQVREIQRRET